jgi:hypothetical protein
LFVSPCCGYLFQIHVEAERLINECILIRPWQESHRLAAFLKCTALLFHLCGSVFDLNYMPDFQSYVQDSLESYRLLVAHVGIESLDEVLGQSYLTREWNRYIQATICSLVALFLRLDPFDRQVGQPTSRPRHIGFPRSCRPVFSLTLQEALLL